LLCANSDWSNVDKHSVMQLALDPNVGTTPTPLSPACTRPGGDAAVR
jgi:hypothetical protein